MMEAAAPRIVPGNAQNQGDRDYQEDAFGFSSRNDPAFVRHAGVAAVLCDGMGGLQFGAESAALAVDTFLDEYRRKLPDETPGAALKRAALRSNDAVFRFARENGVVQRTGCTLVAVVARGVELHCIHAGDSRAYLFSGGRLERLTVDHTYARRLELQVEQGQLAPQEAADHPNRDHLTSNLGRQDLTELDVLDPPRKLTPSDWILLCSDGLHGVLSDQEIAAELHGDSQEAAQRLVQRVTDRPLPEKDNVTVVLMRVGADGALQSSHHTWKTGAQSRDLPAPAVHQGGADSRQPIATKPRADANSKNSPQWVWALTAVPLVLAIGAWLFWPATPKPQPPVVSGVEPSKGAVQRAETGAAGPASPNVTTTVPVVAPVQDLPGRLLPSNVGPATAKAPDSKGTSKSARPTPKSVSAAKPGAQTSKSAPGPVGGAAPPQGTEAKLGVDGSATGAGQSGPPLTGAVPATNSGPLPTPAAAPPLKMDAAGAANGAQANEGRPDKDTKAQH